jgi:hypothetical protein
MQLIKLRVTVTETTLMVAVILEAICKKIESKCICMY